MLSKLKNFGKSGLGKTLGLSALAGGAMLFGQSAFALATSNQNRSKAAAEATAAQEKILMEQLTVQRSMLKTLGEIRDRLPPVGSGNGPSQTKAQLAASDLSSSRSQPINMDINLN